MPEDNKEIRFSSLKSILNKLPAAYKVDLIESIREAYRLQPGSSIEILGTDVYIEGLFRGRVYLSIGESLEAD